jgi:hypothetical protein
MSMIRAGLGLMVAVLLGACQTVQPPREMTGNVELTPVEPPDAERHVLGDDEEFVMGEIRPDARAMPAYPNELLERALAEVSICVELTINEAGTVDSTRAFLIPGRCEKTAADVEAAMKGEVDRAVSTWVYGPSYVCRLPPNAAGDGTCSEPGAERVPVPLLRAYRFVFRQTVQGPSVESEEEAPREAGIRDDLR